MAKKPAARTRAVLPASAAASRHRVVADADRPRLLEVMQRLRRVEGQIRGILQMIEQDQGCDAVAQQLSAARRALDRAFYEMIACSLELELGRSADDAGLRERIAETTRLMAKYA
jgi:CsoR family transcriptional regulator, copper-sensing transcriptional repressor